MQRDLVEVVDTLKQERCVKGSNSVTVGSMSVGALDPTDPSQRYEKDD